MTAFAGYQTDFKGTVQILSASSFFANADSIEVEIGCGKGLFLAEESARCPEKYFLGIESAGTYAHQTEDRIRRRGLKNIQILAWSAEIVLPFFVSQSVKRFHIYFPDPWPKRRHAKRRLWSEAFLKEMARVLQCDGKIYFATDVRAYFEGVEKISQSDETPFAIERKENYRFFEDASSPTTYENKFQEEGRELYFVSLVKKRN